MVDVRGPAGASRAIQDAIRGAVAAGYTAPQVLARVLAEGFPMIDVLPLFAAPPHVPVVRVDDFPADLFAVQLAGTGRQAKKTLPLFNQ